jgi:hypothetical protein
LECVVCGRPIPVVGRGPCPARAGHPWYLRAPACRCAVGATTAAAALGGHGDVLRRACGGGRGCARVGGAVEAHATLCGMDGRATAAAARTAIGNRVMNPPCCVSCAWRSHTQLQGPRTGERSGPRPHSGLPAPAGHLLNPIHHYRTFLAATARRAGRLSDCSEVTGEEICTPAVLAR